MLPQNIFCLNWFQYSFCDARFLFHFRFHFCLLADWGIVVYYFHNISWKKSNFSLISLQFLSFSSKMRSSISLASFLLPNLVKSFFCCYLMLTLSFSAMRKFGKWSLKSFLLLNDSDSLINTDDATVSPRLFFFQF